MAVERLVSVGENIKEFPHPAPFGNEIVIYHPEESALSDIFQNLPIKSGTNLDLLQPLVKDRPIDELKEKIAQRYNSIIKLRQKLGVQDEAKIDLEMSLALIDDQVFVGLLESVREKGNLMKVARHEMSHVFVAVNLGWSVESVTVVPAAGYLGLTISAPRANLDLESYLTHSIAISLAGGIGAQIMGDEPHGTGADHASARAKAQILESFTGVKSEIWFSKGSNIARSALLLAGRATIEKTSANLAYYQTIT